MGSRAAIVTETVSASLPDLLFEHPFADAEPLLHSNDDMLSAGEARAEARAIALMLQAAGVGPGHAVAVQLPNGPHVFTTIFRYLLAGPVFYALNPRVSEPTATPVIARSRYMLLLIAADKHR